MSEKEQKKGARDISDLKARLGLKKGSDGGARQGGAITPPGAGKMGGAYVPPPPGVLPPQPAQPPLPDARVDPFGAMNAMAQQNAVAAAPQIVIVNDGAPVESVQQGERVKAIAKWAAIGLLPLLVGYIVGGIAYKNREYNITIDDAKVLKADVVVVGKSLIDLQNALLTARERGADKQSFLVNDDKLNASLEGLKLQAPDPKRIYHTQLYNMDPQLVEDTFKWYADLAVLYDKVNAHVSMTKGALKKTYARSDAIKGLGGKQFGAIIQMPQQGQKVPPVIQIVEIGQPICAVDQKPHPEGCGNELPIGFQYRLDPSNPAFGSKAWSKDAISADNVIFLGDSPILGILMGGAGGPEMFVDQVGYMQRIQEIEGLANGLIEQKKSIENRLNSKAQESKRFSL